MIHTPKSVGPHLVFKQHAGHPTLTDTEVVAICLYVSVVTFALNTRATCFNSKLQNLEVIFTCIYIFIAYGYLNKPSSYIFMSFVQNTQKINWKFCLSTQSLEFLISEDLKHIEIKEWSTEING